MNDGNYFDDADKLDSQGLGTRDNQAKQAALALIKTFEARKRAGLWPQINRQFLIAGLRDRVRYPNHIDQASTNLCGVVSVMRTWATHNIRDFAGLHTFNVKVLTPAQMLQRLRGVK